MKKNHFASFLAVGVGLASMTASAQIAVNTFENRVFDSKPRSIALQVCDAEALSLGSIQQMIERRNCDDVDAVRSTADNMTHL
ncbi:MAG TPA: hypothetical protein VIH61_07810 [Waddliaceae bacterium]